MSTANKLTYLNTTKEKIAESINNLGGSITSETTFREYAEELEDIYTSLPKVTGEGTEVTLTPTKKGKLQIQIKGNTTDNKNVTGNNNVVVNNKNLFTGLVKGISINGTTGREGTNVNNATSDYIPVNFTQNPNYYLSGLTDTLNTFVWAYNSSKQGLHRTSANAIPGINLTANSFGSGTAQGSGDIAYIRVQQYYLSTSTGTIDDVDNLKIQLEIGDTATDYETPTNQTLPLNLGAIELEENDEIVNINGTYYINDITGTEITDSTLINQLNAIDNMKSYNGTTIITTTYDNSNAPMILNGSALKGE